MKRINPTGPALSYSSGMIDKSGKSGGGGLEQAAASLRAMLADAEAALRSGDTQEGERRAKAVSALVRAVRDVAELEAFARLQPPEEDEESIRAEIRGRIARLVAADRAGAPVAELEQIAAEPFES